MKQGESKSQYTMKQGYYINFKSINFNKISFNEDGTINGNNLVPEKLQKFYSLDLNKEIFYNQYREVAMKGWIPQDVRTITQSDDDLIFYNNGSDEFFQKIFGLDWEIIVGKKSLPTKELTFSNLDETQKFILEKINQNYKLINISSSWEYSFYLESNSVKLYLYKSDKDKSKLESIKALIGSNFLKSCIIESLTKTEYLLSKTGEIFIKKLEIEKLLNNKTKLEVIHFQNNLMTSFYKLIFTLDNGDKQVMELEDRVYTDLSRLIHLLPAPHITTFHENY